MQTMYFETSRFIQHEGNMVDLAAYRQKLSAASGGSWAESSGAAEAPPPQAAPLLTVLPPVETEAARARRRRARRSRRIVLVLDVCASLAVVTLTVCAVAAFLRL